MWLLSFVPDVWLQLAVYTVLFTGVGMYVVSLFLNLMPTLLPYREPIRILGTLLAVAGVWFHGGYEADAACRARVAEMESKVKISEQQSKDANVQIKTVYVDRIKIVKEQQVVIQNKIVEVADKIDAKCSVIPDALDILNQAAKAGTKK